MDHAQTTVIDALIAMEPTVWLNPSLRPAHTVLRSLPYNRSDLDDAAQRLERLSPVLSRLFADTADGIVESRLTRAHGYRKGGTLLLKHDNDLPIAGSVKARGGVYEVLCRAEEIASEAGVRDLDSSSAREHFSRHHLVVASTGNLGLSVGITGRAFGFSVSVHMSRDARAWKKELLRSHGATVVEHEGDYSAAVRIARKSCENDPTGYFVDDETSSRLFLGYSVAVLRLLPQLEDLRVRPTQERPLRVFLPCGVGGGPGGITFGLKQLLGDAVECFFVEPTHAPCCTLGFATGRGADVSVGEYGIDGLTAADGLAVGRASPLVMPIMEQLLDGSCTVRDDSLFVAMEQLWRVEGVKAEPSACAALAAIDQVRLASPRNPCADVAWLTGGSLLPDEEFRGMLAQAASFS
ncbi:MAG: D-serine ammonia-lyase [Spirochaetaceae bacterium]|nr:MAG: D-serine ammonia-lyase [Spirochaetaceae bacterium]